MPKYQKGDKFIIELDKEVRDGNDIYYGLKGFGNVFFSEKRLDAFEKYENKIDKNFKPGDVIYDGELFAVVTRVYSIEKFDIMYSDGSCGEESTAGWEKTGRRVESLKTLMKEIEENYE